MCSRSVRSTSAKAACVILFLAGTAVASLSMRQQRLVAARDMLRLHQRAAAHQRATQRLRVDISAAVLPGAIKRADGALIALAPTASEKSQIDASSARAALATAIVPDDPSLR